MIYVSPIPLFVVAGSEAHEFIYIEQNERLNLANPSAIPVESPAGFAKSQALMLGGYVVMFGVFLLWRLVTGAHLFRLVAARRAPAAPP